MGDKLIYVRFTEQEEYFINDPDNPKKKLARYRQQSKAYMDALTVRAAKGSAEAYRALMKTWLKKGHKYDVGASNAASENLIIKQGKTSSGYAAWIVEEGNATRANTLIRSGFKGHGTTRKTRGPTGSGKANNRTPVINNLRLWAAYKGVTLKLHGQEWKAQLVQPKGGKAYGRAVAGKREETNVVLWLIRRKLWEQGSEGTHWNALWPEKSGRFDYVGYAVKFVNHKQYLGKVAMLLREAVVEFLYSGRKKGYGERYFN